jgi:LuxR family transcriptional regulator, maltose regulon positive regulatory protein
MAGTANHRSLQDRELPTRAPAAGDLLATKFFVPPSRGNWVARPRLVGRLQSVLGRQLTLVSAPAGFGKSSILAEWVQRLPAAAGPSGAACGWLSLDPADNDPVRFWTYAVTALLKATQPDRTHFQSAAARDAALREVLGWLRLDAPPQLTLILDALINGIAASDRPLVLVLDDYHAIGSAPVHESVAHLLQHQPPNLHLVVATRADPPLPLPRLRARGQLVELRAEDLRFSHEETAAFLNQVMGLGLVPDDIAALEARTEGWIAGLQMAALALQSLAAQDAILGPGVGTEHRSQFVQAFSGSHRYILEYLVEEVLNRQPAAVRAFLVQTSILDRLCGPLCAAVMASPPEEGGSAGQAMLETLERANLFVVPLDGERRWYRYHHLFADLLGHRLRQEAPAQDIRALHGRASLWHERNGSFDWAVQHALQAQDFERAASLAERVAQATFFSGRLATLSRWMEALPERLLQERPRLRLYQSWALLIGGQADGAGLRLQQAQQALQALPGSPENDALRLELTRLMARNAALAGAMSSDTAAASVRSLEELARSTADDPVSCSRAFLGLGIAYAFNGQDEEAGVAYARAAELALATGNLILAANVHFIRGNGELYYGRLRQAERLYQRAVDLAHVDPDEAAASVQAAARIAAQLPSGVGYIGLADVARERFDLQAAGRFLDQGLALCQEAGLAMDLCPGYVAQARLRQALGDIPGAFAALRRAAQVYRVELSPAVLLQYVAEQVRLCLAQGDLDEAARWAARPANADPGDATARLPVLLREAYQLILAQVQLARGDAQGALARLDAIAPQAEAAGRAVPELHLVMALAWSGMACTTVDALRSSQARRAALSAMVKSLQAAMPEGYVRLYLDQGSAAQSLLAALREQADLAPDLARYVQDLLNAMAREKASIGEPPSEERAPATVASASARPQPLAEPLSRRELEVLGLISAGCSNQAIADRLVLSLHTVKKHTSNILGKLNATSRVQAVARARELGLF